MLHQTPKQVRGFCAREWRRASPRGTRGKDMCAMHKGHCPNIPDSVKLQAEFLRVLRGRRKGGLWAEVPFRVLRCGYHHGFQTTSSVRSFASRSAVVTYTSPSNLSRPFLPWRGSDSIILARIWVSAPLGFPGFFSSSDFPTFCRRDFRRFSTRSCSRKPRVPALRTPSPPRRESKAPRG